MKKIKLLSWAFIAFTLLATSCSKDDSEPVPQLMKDFTAVIVNQGNWSERNGSISLYNENSNEVRNLAFSQANSNRPLSALVQSFVRNREVGLVICNNPSKIEVVSTENFEALRAPLEGTNVENPRYGVVIGSYAYITCWGSSTAVIGQYPGTTYDIYSYDQSYLIKVDLNTLEIVKTIPCGSDAEGIVASNNRLFVANTKGVRVINIATEQEEAYIQHASLGSFAKQLAVDTNGKVWYSVAGAGLGVIDPLNLTLESEIAMPNIEGSIATSLYKDKLYIILSTTENYLPVKAEIVAVDVNTKMASLTPLYSGKQLVGIKASPRSGYIYTAEIWNYSTNSTMKVINEAGNVVQEQVMGVATSEFAFF